jgi:tetratricopeptide (TPR) repeat protein
LVREHFAEEFSTSNIDDFRRAHSALYEHYLLQSPSRPDTLAEMTSLFYSAYHGCKAERHLEVRDKIFERVLRNDEAFILKTLGAFGAYLSLLANFFQSRWAEPVARLSIPDRIWVMGEAAFCLRGLGRLSEALTLMESAAKLSEDLQDWKTSGIRFRNLIRLYLLRGDFARAIECGSKCVQLADRSDDPFQALSGRAALAYAYTQRGSYEQAERLFLEAEERQTHHQPARPFLYSVLGYLYCDFLLDRGRCNEVVSRASVTIEIALKERWTLQTALDHLSLGRAKAAGATETSKHLDEAVRGLRLSGQIDYLPSGLLARAANLRQTGEFVAAQKDLDEVRVIATHRGMQLYLLDYHLEQARLLLLQSQMEQARPLIARARKLIAEMGYHRRELELQALESEIGAPQPPKPLGSE